MTKAGKYDKHKTTVGIVELEEETKSSEGPGMKTDQAEHLDVTLKLVHKRFKQNCDTEETDTSTTLKRDNRSLSLFDNKDR